jgi:AcrR family transcriptional regulator
LATEYTGTGDPKRTIELLWGVQGPRRRGPKPRLTLDQITATAIAIADRDGLAGVSMRRVADELGVTAMSLYGYVPGKAELLDVMLDRVYGQLPLGEEMPGGWRAQLEAIAQRNWDLYLAHPWLLQVATSRPLLGPNMTAKYDAELSAVDGLGLTDVEMDLVIILVDDYVHGAARGAVEAAQAEARTGMTDEEWWQTYSPLLSEVLDAVRFPTAVRVGSAAGAEYGGPFDPARAFVFGLARLLDGVEAFIEGRSARGPSSSAGSGHDVR